MLAFLKGDIFLSRAQTIAHGCNTRGKMGAGIAVEFRARWPQMFEQYRNLCHRDELQPGGYFLYKDSDPWILNLATQSTTRGATLEHISGCLHAIASSYLAEGITSLAMPRLGAGLGGLRWEDVKHVIVGELGSLTIPVFVYEEYVAGLKAAEGA